MPKFRVLEKCFVDNHLRQEGDVIEYNGEPYSFLEPVDKPAAKVAASPIEKPVTTDSTRKKWTPKAPKDAESGTV
jgi:hypothetical protein